MLIRAFSSRTFLPIFALLVSTGCTRGQAADKAAPDPADVRLRAIVEARLTFKVFVFSEDKFPQCVFEQPAKVEELIGSTSIKTTFFNRELKAVETAASPGVYGAVVEVTPKTGRPMRRYLTLYRAADKIDPAWKFDLAAPEELARRLGIEPAVVKQEASLIGEQLKDRPFAQLATDARVARLFAGLSLEKAGAGAARKNTDAFVQERQYWVNLKRTLDGTDQVYKTPFICPKPLAGEAAPVVRVGSLAEAGMKPDAADKIDAVLQDWAPNDDQAFAVCIVRKGVIVLHKAYGTRDGKPMTVTTKSWMASVTKAMSATLMMMLVEQGLVDLDDPIDKFLPAVRGQNVETPLTIRHLYTHTNGLEKWPGWHDELPDVAERVADYYPRLQVGKAWGYNGTGYMLGGKVIETISGEAVPLFFLHHMLEPLGCPDTDVLGTHADAQSVPLDIAKFGQLLLNQGSYGKLQFFRPETFQKMLPQKLTTTLGPDAVKTFGIGLDGNPDRIGHGAASAATFHVDRSEQLVVVMTRNKMGKVQDKYNGKFWQAIRDGIDKPTEKK